jgi:dienelactone hydrolase
MRRRGSPDHEDGFTQDVVHRLFWQGYIAAAHAFQNFLDATRYPERTSRGSWSETLAFFAQHLEP